MEAPICAARSSQESPSMNKVYANGNEAKVKMFPFCSSGAGTNQESLAHPEAGEIV
ncbi:hypothetical protein [Rhizobium mongolense]|uniref:Uncharacterized protein n=1 Tax=Rhizobium mongolense TaxID=57676 RepID=A0ABR6IYB2_9HYPH|nr:hypothetical protein [Rhizobium mongolense]MBB4232892.1 hypothetical protein [Rhizobium mongolense]